MVTMMTAYTTEVDEADDALSEIFSQIDMNALKKNSVGILSCHLDFVTEGFIAKLCKKLPFDIIGVTTMASANNQGLSMYALVLTVLTSDDVLFETTSTGVLRPDNYRADIASAYAEARGKLPGDPSMIVAFFPMAGGVSGASLTGALFDVCGDVPVLGSLAINLEFQYDDDASFAFKNSGVEGSGMSMLLMHGPVNPEFFVVSVPKQQIRENRGMITDSEGSILKEINGLPAQTYLSNMGFIIMKEATSVTPFMVYYEGSTEPVALAIYSVNDDGSYLCAGDMPKGALVAVGEVKQDSILSTAEEFISRILHSGKKNGALLFPCVTRYVMLVPDQSSEMERIAAMMGSSMPYMLAYSGGEVCPMPDGEGNLQNRFHNFTISGCVF